MSAPVRSQGRSNVALPAPRARKLTRHAIDYVARQLRRASGELEGLSYRLAGKHPAADVGDDVLTARVRSMLGPIEKQLDVPHVNVMVEQGVVLLHGVVAREHDAEQLAEAVLDIPGVREVDSYLHVGLGAGDTRPSEGRTAPQVSDAHRRLVEAAVRSGVEEPLAVDVVRAVLGTFADRLPPDERDHVAHHLPADVRPMFAPPRRVVGRRSARNVTELVARVCAASDAVPAVRAEAVVEGVLATLRSLVPEELEDVAAVLPADLRELWVFSVPT
jgi:uncharacterized protein (DUF2267 family)